MIYEFVLWSPAIALGLFILYLLIFLIRFQKGWNEKINLEEFTVDSVEITDLNSEAGSTEHRTVGSVRTSRTAKISKFDEQRNAL